LLAFRDRFNIPLSDEQVSEAALYKPADDSEELKYMHERREELGGFLLSKWPKAPSVKVPNIKIHEKLLAGTEGRKISTTMAFVRILNALIKDKVFGKFVVPIVPDEARTFGMEGMFRQLGIYSSIGQLYEPMDSDQVMFYREDKKGQILEEGINEAGAFSSWIAAATAYKYHGVQMIPFYIYYSMFGFQRVGDLAWAAGDLRSRGFLLGGTAGRTTLAGEGLQHQDGHSHLNASTIPNCISYDPTYAYELAVIIHSGLKRMYENQEDIYYYLSVMNENYEQPKMPEGVEEGILKGMYLLRKGGKKKLQIQLLGSGTILREIIAGADLLKEDFGVDADIWSVTSFNELRREGLDVDRWNMLHPNDKPRECYVTQCLGNSKGPIIAATDYMKIYADQIRNFIPGRYEVLGTDGYGRSDTRKKLREFFEVNRYYVCVAALKSLADEGMIDSDKVDEAIKKYDINPDKPNPVTV